MSALFRYPCACGVEHAVAAHQAGESLRCQCGLQLELPTMRELREYPPVEGSQDRSRPRWSATRGVIFNMGLIVTLCSLAALFTWGRQRWQLDVAKPELRNSELYHLEVNSWTVEMAWTYWTLAKQTDLRDRLTPRYQEARRLAGRLTACLTAAAICLGLGVAAMTVALLGRGAWRQPATPSI